MKQILTYAAVLTYSLSSRSSSVRTAVVTATSEMKKVQSCGSNCLLDKALTKTPCQQQAGCTGRILTHRGAFAVVLQLSILNIPDPPAQHFKFNSSIHALLPFC